MAPVVAAAAWSSISSRSALLCPLPLAPTSMGDDGVRRTVRECADQGAWGDARVCCAPRISIAPRAAQHAASALILFHAVAVGVADLAALSPMHIFPRQGPRT